MAVLVPTRRAWHGVAELVLAGPQHRDTGELALAVVPGGFRTTAGPDLRVEGVDLVYPGGSAPIDGATCASLAAAAGVAAGAPKDLYGSGSSVAPDEVLRLDPDAVAVLAAAFATAQAALRAFAPEQIPILWPEHFDLAITVGEVNYGVSAGDSYQEEPYAYVGPWTPRDGAFWNAPFGAARAVTELSDVDAVVAFFTQGRDLAQPS
jgi:hypothetical protein